MQERQRSYFQSCSMTGQEIESLVGMLEQHQEFSSIKIVVNSERGSYSQEMAERVPEGNSLVTLEYPSEGVNMANFYKEFASALQERVLNV